MPKSLIPLVAVPSTAIAYGLLFKALDRKSQPSSTQAKLKAISAGHATLTTVLSLYALRSSGLGDGGNSTKPAPTYLTGGNLDDGSNPLIWGGSSLASAITALETGYLIYDTVAMVLHPSPPGSRKPAALLAHAAKRSPDLLAHHVLLATGLLALQYYIYEGRERGVWVIVLFILMNASTPFMHARWWARKRGASSRIFDLAFAAAFAACRFGSIAWVLREYGRYHQLGTVEAFRMLRWYCQTGTATLLAMNGLWWILLIKGIIKRRPGTKIKI